MSDEKQCRTPSAVYDLEQSKTMIEQQLLSAFKSALEIHKHFVTDLAQVLKLSREQQAFVQTAETLLHELTRRVMRSVELVTLVYAPVFNTDGSALFAVVNGETINLERFNVIQGNLAKQAKRDVEIDGERIMRVLHAYNRRLIWFANREHCEVSRLYDEINRVGLRKFPHTKYVSDADKTRLQRSQSLSI